MKNKKGVELGLNTVVIIVIVLVILILIIVLIAGGFKNLFGTTNCESKTSTSIPYDCKSSCVEGTEQQYAWGCPNKGDICCGPPLLGQNG